MCGERKLLGYLTVKIRLGKPVSSQLSVTVTSASSRPTYTVRFNICDMVPNLDSFGWTLCASIKKIYKNEVIRSL